MCLFLEILRVKKCRNSSGGYFPVTVNITLCRKYVTTFFEITSLSSICENITDDGPEIN